MSGLGTENLWCQREICHVMCTRLGVKKELYLRVMVLTISYDGQEQEKLVVVEIKCLQDRSAPSDPHLMMVVSPKDICPWSQ